MNMRPVPWHRFISAVVVALLIGLSACGTNDADSTDEQSSVAGPSAAADGALIEPGRFGALTIGMDGDAAVATGLATGPDSEAICGDIYATEPGLSEKGMYLDFDSEAPYPLRLAGVSQWGMGDEAPSVDFHTKGGLTLGSPVRDVIEEYGDDTVFASFQAEGGPYGAYVAFDGEGGALQVLVDSAEQADATVVTGLIATSGRSLDDVIPLVGGC